MPRTKSPPALGKPGATKRVPLERLRPFPGNAWEGDVDALKASLVELGQYKPIVVNVRAGTTYGDGTILAGNHTHLVHRELLEETGERRWSRIDAKLVDVDDDKAKKINVVDNRIPQLGAWNNEALAELLDGVDEEELTVIGFDQPTLEGLTVPPPAPEPPDEFQVADPDAETDFCCPSCGYEWSGNPK